jgi:hypothetical protein
LNGAPEQQQLFRERGLARVGVGDDGKRASTLDFIGYFCVRHQSNPRICTRAYVHAYVHSMETKRGARPSEWARKWLKALYPSVDVPRHREFDGFVMAWGLGGFKVTKKREVTLKPPSLQAFRAGPLNVTVQGTSFEGPRSCGLIRTRRPVEWASNTRP